MCIDHHTVLSAAVRWMFLSALLGYALVRPKLTTWLFLGMLAGAEIGHDLPTLAFNLRVLSQIFLRLTKAIIAPLVFSALVSGIAGQTDLKGVRRMGLKAICYFEVVTTLALVIGLCAINMTRVGFSAGLPQPPATDRITVKRPNPIEIVLEAFPENIAKSVVDNQMLQIVVFSILFGTGLLMAPKDKARSMLAFTESLSEVMFKFTSVVMLFAPLGVMGALASTVAIGGFGVMFSLFWLLATFYGALFVFLAVVLLPIACLVHVPVRQFIRAVSESTAIAFSTSSSEAALPRAIEAMVSFGVRREIAAFVIPCGYCFNMDGSTLYLSLASVFVAQAAGIHLTLSQQLLMMFTLMLTSKGVSGVSRASLVILLGTANQFGLPTEPILAILGIDHLMDMARTSVNVVGNCLASVVIACWEGEFKDHLAASAVS